MINSITCSDNVAVMLPTRQYGLSNTYKGPPSRRIILINLRVHHNLVSEFGTPLYYVKMYIFQLRRVQFCSRKADIWYTDYIYTAGRQCIEKHVKHTYYYK